MGTAHCKGAICWPVAVLPRWTPAAAKMQIPQAPAPILRSVLFNWLQTPI